MTRLVPNIRDFYDKESKEKPRKGLVPYNSDSGNPEELRIKRIIYPISNRDKMGCGAGLSKYEREAIRYASLCLNSSFYKESSENQARIVNDLISKLSEFT